MNIPPTLAERIIAHLDKDDSTEAAQLRQQLQ